MPKTASPSGVFTLADLWHETSEEVHQMIIAGLSREDLYNNASRASYEIRQHAQRALAALIPPGTGGAMSRVRKAPEHKKDAWNHAAAHTWLARTLVDDCLAFDKHDGPLKTAIFTDDDHVVMTLDDPGCVRQFALTPYFEKRPVNLRESPVVRTKLFKHDDSEIGWVLNIQEMAGGTMLLVSATKGIFIYAHDKCTSALGVFPHPDDKITVNVHASGDGKTILATYGDCVAVWQWGEWGKPLALFPIPHQQLSNRQLLLSSLVDRHSKI